MSSIWVTGDCHADYSKFTKSAFPIQKEMSREDYMIVCGDFGIWHNTAEERYRLDELSHRNFTTLFCDGNHSNFDRLCTDAYRKYMRGEDITNAGNGEFPLVPMFGGTIQQIRPGVYHLLRGEVYEICGKKIFVFGGASSHDIDDGILDRANYDTEDAFFMDCYLYRKTRRMFRVAHESWWKEELPSKEEMRHGMASLERNGFKVDYIITHCLPTSAVRLMGFGGRDILTDYLQKVYEKTAFDKWFCGHYHMDRNIDAKICVTYRNILPVFDNIAGA